MLTITHSSEEGTLIEGTERGDGTGEVLKACGWRWSRHMGMWFVPRSRDAAPKRAVIESTQHALTGAGFEVDIEIDATPRDQGEVVTDRMKRSREREATLRIKSARLRDKATRHDAASDALSASFPAGQPLLPGHHSFKAASRRQEKLHAHARHAVELQRDADRLEAAADAARSSAASVESPHVVARRIDRLGAQVRKIKRNLDSVRGRDGSRYEEYRARMGEELRHLEAQLEHWEQVRAQQVSTGATTNYGKDTVATGDLVKVRGDWYRVARANAKTVSLETGYSWVQRTPWHEVQNHRAQGPTGDA